VGVAESKGVLSFARRRSVSKTYSILNSGGGDKTSSWSIRKRRGRLGGSRGIPGKGRREIPLLLGGPLGKKAALVVVERIPSKETVVLSTLNSDSLLRYSSSSEIPAAVRKP
jgi:hypothetical protein